MAATLWKTFSLRNPACGENTRDAVWVAEYISGEPYLLEWWATTTDALERYGAWLEGGTLRTIEVEWGYHPPSLSQVIDCLGPPEFYIAQYLPEPEAVRASLELIYQDRGMVVRYDSPFTSIFRPEPPSEFHPYLRINELTVTAPGTPEQIVIDIYQIVDLDSDRAVVLCQIRPWPGSFEAIEFVPWREACT